MNDILETVVEYFKNINPVYAVLGYLTSKLIDYIEDKSKKELRKMNNHNISQNRIVLASDAVDPLDHSAPWYSDNGIRFSDSKEKYFITSKNNKQITDNFVFHENDCFFSKTFEDVFEQVCSHLEGIDIEKLYTMFENSRVEVEEDIKEKINNGQTLFNGMMIGIRNFRPERNPKKNEESEMVIKYYETDFFTHRVMARLYQKIKNNIVFHEENIIRTKEKWSCETLNIFYPFMTSIGVDTLLFVDENLSTTILTRRSDKLPNMSSNKGRGLWHVSMNEAVSETDFNDDNNSISLRKCVVRGLKEELGIDCEQRNTNIKFGDFFFVRDLFEVGITSAVMIPEINDIEVKEMSQRAKDSRLEYLDLKGISVNDLKEDIKTHGDYYTEACKYTAIMMLARIKDIKDFI